MAEQEQLLEATSPSPNTASFEDWALTPLTLFVCLFVYVCLDTTIRHSAPKHKDKSGTFPPTQNFLHLSVQHTHRCALGHPGISSQHWFTLTLTHTHTLFLTRPPSQIPRELETLTNTLQNGRHSNTPTAFNTVRLLKQPRHEAGGDSANFNTFSSVSPEEGF